LSIESIDAATLEHVTAVAVTLVSKPGCHLCDAAREVVDAVVAELGSVASVTEVSILDDPQLFDRYVEEIPVVLINGKVHNIWRIDPVRLRNALVEAAA
jgi:metal-sulfur cluster biosynthetic enzyme